MVTGITGACGNTNRTGPTASSCSSSVIGTKSLPSAPRPCSHTTVAVGLGAVSFSMLSSRLMDGQTGGCEGLAIVLQPLPVALGHTESQPTRKDEPHADPGEHQQRRAEQGQPRSLGQRL